MISLILFFICSSYSWATCETHQKCMVGDTCKCIVGTTVSSDRFFYFDFLNIQRGHHYECNFHNSIGVFSIVLNESIFPEGVTYQCQGSCPRFPVKLIVDTQQMKSTMDLMVIKYFVPASDIPSDVEACCKITS